MATYQTRKRKNGKISVTSTVRLKDHKPISRTFDNKTQARIWAAEVESDIIAKRYHDPRLAEKVSLKEALDKYRSAVTVFKAVTTQDREQYSRKHLERIIGSETPLTGITSAIVATYRDTRLREASAYSVRQEMAMLSHMFNKARQEWGIYIENPVKSVQRPPPPTGRDRFLDHEEAKKLLYECRQSRLSLLYPYVILLMHTGMRASEAARLKWKDINIDQTYLVLKQTKNNSQRRVPLTKFAVKALLQMKLKRAQPEEYLFLQPRHLLVPRIIARPCIIFRDSFKSAKIRAGLTDVRLHDLRHTAASHLIMAGVDLRTLADILGHQTLQMVQRYTHLLDEHKQKAVDRIGNLGME